MESVQRAYGEEGGANDEVLVHRWLQPEVTIMLDGWHGYFDKIEGAQAGRGAATAHSLRGWQHA